MFDSVEYRSGEPLKAQAGSTTGNAQNTSVAYVRASCHASYDDDQALEVAGGAP